MYRVGSSPGADQSVLVIRDAGVDRENQCFVMVLEAQGSGYETLAGALAERKNFAWLQSRDVHRDMEARHQLWLGFQHLANGLRILHEQHVLHRSVNPEAVFFNPECGTSSFRLGGFEWSLRLGVAATNSPPPEKYWSSPPEFFSDKPAYRPETDWYAFGVLAIRCLLDLESYGSEEPVERHHRLIEHLDRATQPLSDLESTFLYSLIAPEPRDRLTHWPEIRATLQDIIDRLEYGAVAGRDERSLVLVINPQRSIDLADKAQQHGFQLDPNSSTTLYSPYNPMHLALLKQFLQHDLADAQLYKRPTEPFWVLNGRCLALRISPYRDPRTRESTWAYAYSENVASVVHRQGDPEPVNLPQGKVVVWTTSELRQSSTRPNTQSWQRYLPRTDPIALDLALTRFHDFICCTNQLELLIRDAEIFGYELVARPGSEDSGFETIVIQETPRLRKPMSIVEVTGGLTVYLEREIESGKPHCQDVMLTGPDEDSLLLNQRMNPRESWQITDIDGVTKCITLQRRRDPDLRQTAEKGHVRTWGMFGQVRSDSPSETGYRPIGKTFLFAALPRYSGPCIHGHRGDHLVSLRA